MTPGVPGHVGDDVAECQCGGDRFHVVYKAPVYAVVEAGEVVRVVVADESVDGPLVSECTECGRSDVAGDAGAEAARVVAETKDWPGWDFGS
ncbi:MAG: hypothetical protein Q8K72_05995 [Acidimicrobiales bacterium]|jgi:uncharacterized protein CbrC (UPF0167 family)|nr:hypothetical protein [Acidimicrobiales bacterium]